MPPVSEITIFPLEMFGFVEGPTPFARLETPFRPDRSLCLTHNLLDACIRRVILISV
jgi:hypothetical protein